MTRPVRLQLSRCRGFDLQAASAAANGLPAVNVARPSPWGNPFVVGKHGDAAYCVDLYKALLSGMLRVGAHPDIEALERTRRFVAENAAELTGKNLACWCRLPIGGERSGEGRKEPAPCHADVLLKLANRSAGGASA